MVRYSCYAKREKEIDHAEDFEENESSVGQETEENHDGTYCHDAVWRCVGKSGNFHACAYRYRGDGSGGGSGEQTPFRGL